MPFLYCPEFFEAYPQRLGGSCQCKIVSWSFLPVSALNVFISSRCYSDVTLKHWNCLKAVHRNSSLTYVCVWGRARLCVCVRKRVCVWVFYCTGESWYCASGALAERWGRMVRWLCQVCLSLLLVSHGRGRLAPHFPGKCCHQFPLLVTRQTAPRRIGPGTQSWSPFGVWHYC